MKLPEPTNEEASREGWKAAWQGWDKDANPYYPYTSLWSNWMDGWFEAMMCKLKTEPTGMGAAFARKEEND